MADFYDQLLDEGTDLLWEINPISAHQGMAHCPETADAVHDFLNDGDRTAINTSATATYPMTGSFQTRTLSQITTSLHSHGRHRVVRGVRSATHPTLTRHHYFVIANIRGTRYVIDAYTHEIRTDIAAYVEFQEFQSLQVATHNFDVSISDPMQSSDPLGGL